MGDATSERVEAVRRRYRTDGEPTDGSAANGSESPDAGSGVERGTVRTNGVETYYERRGDGPPVVFVHATVMDHLMWAPQVEALSDEFTTVTYDLRGHGRTGGSDRESYSVALYAADLDALLTGLGVENPVVCGLSLGGCIAQVYAATYPEKVAGVVLSDTFTPGPLGADGRLIFATYRLFGLLDRFVPYERLNRLQVWVGQRLAPGVAGDGVTAQRLIDEGPTMPHREFAKVMEALAAFPRGDFDASRVAVPALVIYGENGPAFIRKQATLIRDRVANADATVTVVPDAGHASNLDTPEFFTDAVRSFARRVGERGD